MSNDKPNVETFNMPCVGCGMLVPIALVDYHEATKPGVRIYCCGCTLSTFTLSNVELLPSMERHLRQQIDQ